MSVQKTLSDYPDISFIDNMSLEDIKDFYLKAMKDRYRELTGRELVMKEADPVRLIAYADCLLLYQIVQYADRAGKLALLKYSYGDYLENIGALKGIRRMEGAASRTTLQFTLSGQRNNVTTIPAGTRVTAGDEMYFETTDILEIAAGNITGKVNAACKVSGIKGNGYKIGELKIMVDPIPYVEKVENLIATEGGADLETDTSLSERIYLAPSSWSTAGPDDAYRYWVRTFDPAVTDVWVGSEVPGIVEICFIMQGGQIPEESMTGDLEKYLRDEKIRPLTDQVIVRAPDVQKYGIDITYYINRSDQIQTAAIQKKVLSAVQECMAEREDWEGYKSGPAAQNAAYGRGEACRGQKSRISEHPTGQPGRAGRGCHNVIWGTGR